MHVRHRTQDPSGSALSKAQGQNTNASREGRTDMAEWLDGWMGEEYGGNLMLKHMINLQDAIRTHNAMILPSGNYFILF